MFSTVSIRFWPGRWILCALAALSLTACGGAGGGNGGGGGGGSSTTFTIGGNISGLSSAGLVLTDNGGNNLTVASGATTFAFAQPVTSGSSYSVAVATQPVGETCTVTAASGTATADVSSVSVACTVNTYTIGGAISGLSATGLVLADNGGDDLSVTLGATTFTFSQALQSGSAYNVTVAQQPTGETCLVTSGSGTATAKVTNVTVECAVNMYTVGGSVSGLTYSGLILSLNGLYTLPVSANATSFAFTNTVAQGSRYAVTVNTQPTNESCTVANGSGTVLGNVATVQVTCSLLTYSLAGRIYAPVSGLSAGLTLQEYAGGQTLVIPPNATGFVFNPVAAGTYVDVTAITQPSWQTCTPGASNINGPIETYITNDSFTCAIDTAVGASVTLPSGTAFSGPDGVAVDAAGDVFIADSGNNRIVEVAASSGIVTYPLTAAQGLSGPMGVAVNSAGTIVYVANTGAGDVLEDNNGTVTMLASGFSSPDGIAVDSSGDIFVADTGHSKVDEVSPTGSTVTQLASTYSFYQPSGITVDSSGNVYVADTGNSAIVEISGSTVKILAGTYNYPFGVAVDSVGNVYVADSNDFEIRMITPTGGVFTVAGSSSNSTSACTPTQVSFRLPYGVAVSNATDQLYVSDYAAGTVCQLTP